MSATTGPEGPKNAPRLAVQLPKFEPVQGQDANRSPFGRSDRAVACAAGKPSGPRNGDGDFGGGRARLFGLACTDAILRPGAGAGGALSAHEPLAEGRAAWLLAECQAPPPGAQSFF